MPSISPTAARVPTAEIPAMRARARRFAAAARCWRVDHPNLGSDQQPHGVRVVFHSGAQIVGMFRHTLSAGQRPAAAFRQEGTV
jgi:hypothetical protein